MVTVKLDDLIEVAVRHAPDLARAKVDRSVAKGQAGAARRDQAWVFSANANFAREGIGGDVVVDPLTIVATDKQSVSAGLGRRLPTGGTISLDLGFQREKKEYAISPDLLDAIGAIDQPAGGTSPAQTEPVQEFVTGHQTFASLSLTQPLLRGIGSEVALAAENKADLAYSEATINAQLEAEKMVLSVVRAYWELAYASYEVDVRFEGLDLAQRQEKMTREEIRAGVAPATSLNAVIYEIAVREESKLTSQMAYEKKSLELRRIAGLELGRRELVMRPGEAFVVGNDEWDVRDVLARSKQANRRLVALGLRRRSAEIDVKVAKNGMLPQVDLSLSGGLLGAGTSADSAFANASSGAGFQVMAGLKVSWEISGAARSAHQAAVAQKTRVEVDRLDVERSIDTEVVSAVRNVTAARARVGLADRAIAVADDNVTAERAAFKAARSDNFKVMQRQSDLIEARLRRGRAVADYHIAVAQLQYLSGMLLEQYRINVRPRQGRR